MELSPNSGYDALSKLAMKTFTFANKRPFTGVMPSGMTIPFPSDSSRRTDSAAVRRILRGTHLQAKLAVGAPDDVHEQEADRVADEVMRMPGPALKPGILNSSTAPFVQGKRAEKIPDRQQIPPIVQDVLSSSGQPLDARPRSFFELRFGHDFGKVRLHTNARAKASAQAVNALAYTVGSHIVLGEGQNGSETMAGNRLLAHELAHVVQQSATAIAVNHALQRKKNSEFSDEQKAEVKRLEEEMKKLAGRNAWTGVDRAYKHIESMGEDAFKLAGNTPGIHRLGAEAAKILGDFQRYQTLLLRAKTALDTDVGQIDDTALKDVLDELTNIERTYGAVRIGPQREPKSKREKAKLQGPELEPAEWPFAPFVRKSIETASTEIKETGYFTGLIPAGDYTIGVTSFTLYPGTEFGGSETLNVFWEE